MKIQLMHKRLGLFRVRYQSDIRAIESLDLGKCLHFIVLLVEKEKRAIAHAEHSICRLRNFLHVIERRMHTPSADFHLRQRADRHERRNAKQQYLPETVHLSQTI